MSLAASICIIDPIGNELNLSKSFFKLSIWLFTYTLKPPTFSGVIPAALDVMNVTFPQFAGVVMTHYPFVIPTAKVDKYVPSDL